MLLPVVVVALIVCSSLPAVIRIQEPAVSSNVHQENETKEKYHKHDKEYQDWESLVAGIAASVSRRSRRRRLVALNKEHTGSLKLDVQSLPRGHTPKNPLARQFHGSLHPARPSHDMAVVDASFLAGPQSVLEDRTVRADGEGAPAERPQKEHSGATQMTQARERASRLARYMNGFVPTEVGPRSQKQLLTGSAETVQRHTTGIAGSDEDVATIDIRTILDLGGKKGLACEESPRQRAQNSS